MSNPQSPDLVPPVPANSPDATFTSGSPAAAQTSRTGSRLSKTTIFPRVAVNDGRIELQQWSLDRFETVRALGEGALGEVQLVRDRDVHRLVAVKTLRAEKHDSATVARFVEEARTVGQLEHPNIGALHDVGVDEEGRYYLIMKYVEGETLESIIAKLAAGDRAYHERFTFEYRALVFRDVLRAIDYAHSRGIIHRDLKPANIVVGPNGEATVMDWGLAKKIRETSAPGAAPSELLKHDLDTVELKSAETRAGAFDSSARMFTTDHGSILGTPAYMSPEQAVGRSDELDERSDIYSLAAIFYRLLALRHYIPLKQTTAEMLRAVVYEEPLEAGALTFGGLQQMVPRELSELVKTGLSKDPRRRHQSVQHMLDELQGCLEGRHCVVCPPTLVKHVWSIVRRGIDARSRWTTGVTLGSLFAALILAFYGLISFIRDRNVLVTALLAGVFLFMVGGAFVAPGRRIAKVRSRNRKLGFR
jgi:serine/threonine-protein kinase